jgi:predicted MFS family arabinose efflux permease
MLCLAIKDVPRSTSERARPRSILATAGQHNLLPVWAATVTFFIAVLAVFSFIKTFVIATVAGPLVGYAIERAGYSRSFLGLAVLLAMGTLAFYSLDRGRTRESES